MFARYLSADKDGRVKASQKLKNKGVQFTGDKELFVESIRRALYAAKIISYTQGYLLMASAAKEYGWNLNFGGIALMWRGGCIIRSAFLGKITDAFKEEPNLENLLFAPYFGQAVEEALPGWRSVCAEALNQGIPLPAMTSALSYYDGLRLARGSANLLQAQRDYFGAHTYERVDHERGEFFHTNWTGKGGDTSSSTYNA